MTNTLAQHQTVSEIVRVYEQAVTDLKKGFALVAGAERMLNRTFTLEGVGRIYVRGRYDGRGVCFERPEEAIEMLRRDCWRHIIDRLELRRVMSIKRWKQLEVQLNDEELPPITHEAVMGFARKVTDDLDEMMSEAVTEIFDWLRPPQSEFKTNTEFEIGKRVIIAYGVEARCWSKGFQINYYREQMFTALENVFQVLDGRGFANKHHRSELATSLQDGESSGSTTYYRYRCFKKGTIHIEFTRPELVTRLNQIAGGNRLKSASS